jgi:predicted flap endonuclease-1-like 5' DNA nuclease
MSEKEGGLFSCRNTCWIAGALLGLAAFLLIMKVNVLAGLVGGLVLAVGVALVLLRLFCAAGVGMAHHHVAHTAAVTTGAGPSAALDHSDDDRSRAAADAAASAMMGDEETASGIAGEGGRTTPAAALNAAAVKADAPARTHAEMQTAPAAAKAKPAAKPKAATTGGAKGATAKGSATKSATATAKADRKPVAKDGKPELLTKPKGGAGDDLKLIKGVGPKLEQTLNEMGVWHYEQIAGWRKKEVEWVDNNLSFKGRIERDDWIKQAKTLAKGGTTEFSKRAAKTGKYDKT